MDTNLRMLPDSIPRECSTKHAAGLLTYCSFVQPSHLIGSDLDSEQTILQITAAGLCKNLTCFPKTECGCKGTTKFADLQILCRKSFRSTKSKVFSCGRNRKAKLMSGNLAQLINAEN